MYRREMIERVALAKECLEGVSSYKEYVLFPDGSRHFMVKSISGFFDCSDSKVLSESCRWCPWFSKICVRR